MNNKLIKLLDYTINEYGYKRDYLNGKSINQMPYYYYKNGIGHFDEEYSFLSCKNKILKMDKRYIFLFSTSSTSFLKDPEDLTKKDLKFIKSLLCDNNNDFYALCALSIYNYNKGNYSEVFFIKLVKLNKNNPYLLSRYARFHASYLYKLNNDKRKLIVAEKELKLALMFFKNIFLNKQEIPSYIYSWLGLVYIELEKYKDSLKLFDLSIEKDKELDVYLGNPYIWKSISLNKLGFYNESNNLLFKVKKFNMRGIDFRYYRLLTNNYLHLKKYQLAEKELVIGIDLFLKIEKSIIIKSDFIITNNIILKNEYESFLLYYNNFKKIIILFGFSFIKYGENKSLRGLDKLSYLLLKTKYE